MKKVYPKFRGIVDGGLRVDKQGLFNNFLSKMNGTRVIISVEPEEKARTINQNRLYWLYIRIISEETGHGEDDLHALFKQKFLPNIKSRVFDEEVTVIKSTTRLNTDEFSEYINKIEELVGIPVPSLESLYI